MTASSRSGGDPHQGIPRRILANFGVSADVDDGIAGYLTPQMTEGYVHGIEVLGSHLATHQGGPTSSCT